MLKLKQAGHCPACLSYPLSQAAVPQNRKISRQQKNVPEKACRSARRSTPSAFLVSAQAALLFALVPVDFRFSVLLYT
jgi:hypothetical protein